MDGKERFHGDSTEKEKMEPEPWETLRISGCDGRQVGNVMTGELRPSPAAEGLPASQQRRLSGCFAAVFPGEEGQRNRG